MFRELTMEEKYETEGGAWPWVVKILIGIAVAGVLKGCSNSAADDIREDSSNSVSSGDSV